MTFYPINQNEVFTTRIEAHPEYLISNTGSQYLTYRDRYNTSSIYHTYYYTTSGDPLPFYTCSIDVFNNISITSSMGGAIRSIQEYYSLIKENYGSLISYTGSICILNIPRMYYGLEFSNLVLYESGSSFGSRVTYDNGSGSLIVTHSGPAATVYQSDIEIGNVFPSEGIAFVYCTNSFSTNFFCTSSYQISFTGSNNIYVQNVFCHAKEYQANASNNDTAYTTASNGEKIKVLTGSDDKVFISGIGLYDENMKLIATAKFSSPIRKLPNDKLLFKLRTDIL